MNELEQITTIDQWENYNHFDPKIEQKQLPKNYYFEIYDKYLLSLLVKSSLLEKNILNMFSL